MSPVDAIDGRTARRNRNKDAVLDALVELVRESDGLGEPSVEAIAERAAVSYRSVYRYFDDRTELMLSAIGRVMGDSYSIFDMADLGDGPLDTRIARLIEVRLGAYRRLGPLTRIAVRLRADEPAVAEVYEDVRLQTRVQLETQFAPELDAVAPQDRAGVIAAIDAMFQSESLDYLAQHEGLDDAVMTQVLSRHIRAHLGVSG
jgi:TetR/AcrR family transcriptional regulator of autoinduction and epiphytic fitness